MAKQKRVVYHCSQARKDLGTLYAVLSDVGLLAGDLAPDQIDDLIARCEQCRRDKAKPRHCRGWRLGLGPGTRMQFRPTEVTDPPLRPEVTAALDFRRTNDGYRDAWEAAPMADGRITLELYEVSSNELVERYHVDLAARNQEGPVWHLQRGGNSASGQQLDGFWFQYPRFPVLPADLILVAELVAFNFYYDVWIAELKTKGEWTQLIQRAEDLLLTHWRDALAGHFGSGSGRAGTWLAVEDNLAGSLAARPV